MLDYTDIIGNICSALALGFVRVCTVNRRTTGRSGADGSHGAPVRYRSCTAATLGV